MKQVEMGRGGVMFDGLKSACACESEALSSSAHAEPSSQQQ